MDYTLITFPVYAGVEKMREYLNIHIGQSESKKACDFMNIHATTILPGILAADVMQIMTSHTPPFNVLPIVDKAGNAVGLIHIHDLIVAGVHD